MATRKHKPKHIAEAAGSYVGEAGELILNTSTNTLKVSDGSTAGGTDLAIGPGVSVIRALRANGGSSNDTSQWTITTVKGNATGAMEVINTNQCIRFTLTGFKALPSAFFKMHDGVDYPTDQLGTLLQSLGTDATMFTAFDPATYKPWLLSHGTSAYDYYYLIKE